MTETDRPAGDDPGRRLEELLAEHRDDPEGDDDPADGAAPEPFDPFAPVATTREPEPEPGSDADPGDDLPDAPLFALLRTVESEIGVDRIDRLWIFPPRRLEVGETAVVVVAAFPDTDSDRRRVYAAHYTVHDEAREPRLALNEYGTAPRDRVGRLVEEVVERIKDGPTGAPRSHPVDGDDDRWTTLLHDLAHAYLAEVQKDPRLRR